MYSVDAEPERRYSFGRRDDDSSLHSFQVPKFFISQVFIKTLYINQHTASA